MENKLKEQFLEQLGSIITDYESHKNLSKDDYTALYTYITRSLAVIERISGKNSIYYHSAKEIAEQHKNTARWKVKSLIGVVKALLCDLQQGYLTAISEIIHGEIFSDFLEMACYLFEEGYKDASAIIATGTLENHLKQLCLKHNTIELTSERFIRVSQINEALNNANIYTSPMDYRNVQAWMILRNKAAHGEYGDYTKEQVRLLIDEIRDFITRNPA